jgi:asparagine synthase (glutamine-hydrolysing)
LVDDHQSGARDYSPSLWALLMFDAFLRTLSGEVAAPAMPARRVAIQA